MDRKPGPVLLLLVCCIVLAASQKIKSDSETLETARRMMKACNQMECGELYEKLTAPTSDVEKTSDRQDSPSIALRCFLKDFQRSVSFSDPPSKLPCPSDKTGFSTSEFITLNQKMNNIKGASQCCVDALMCPMAWKALISEDDVNMTSAESEVLLKCVNKMLKTHPKKLELPKTVNKIKFESLMMALKMNYPTLKDQRKEIMKWAKEKFKEKYLDCKAQSDSDKCEKWVTCPAVKMLGPYISNMPAADIERFPQEDLCECLESDQFKPIMDKMDKPKPSFAKKLLNKIKTCPEFPRRMDSLGPLLCYYKDLSKKLTPDQSRTLLNKISPCPGLAKLKKRLTEWITQRNLNDVIQKDPWIVSFLSKKELDKLDMQNVVAILKNTSVKLEKKLKRKLLKRYLGDKKCADLSVEEFDLKVLVQTTEVLPKCVVKKMLPQVRRDLALLKDMTPRKSQRVAMVEELLKDLDSKQLIDLPDKFLQAVPTRNLKKVKFESLENVPNKLWGSGQACLLAKKYSIEVADWYKNPGSLTQCITCKMIRKIATKNVWEMAFGFADASQWLSRNLARCAAQKLFKTLALERPDYFKTITVNELRRIPPVFLIHLPAKQMDDLPVPVYPDFLKKMEVADLSTLPVDYLLRQGLMNKALKFLGKDVSTLSSDDVKMLGPLFCEVQPSQLRPLPSVVLKNRLQDLATCHDIPKEHREAVAQLVTDSFGEPDTWPDVTWEDMSPLLTKCPLPTIAKKKLKEVKDSIKNFLQRSKKPILKKCLFELILSDSESDDSSTVTRRKREGRPHIHRNKRSNSGTSNTTTSNTNTSAVMPTVELIKELKQMNDNWTPQQLDNMTLDIFNETVEILGDVTSYDPQQLEVLRNKAIEVWGDAGSMDEDVVTQLGCIAQGFRAEELMTMALSQSSLEDIASCGWNPTQISAVWKGAAKHNNLSPERLDASDLVEINRFICGLSASEIQQLNNTVFKDAVESITDVVCTTEMFQHFNVLVVEAFGAPSTWTEEDLSNLGTFVASLNADEFSSLDVSIYSFLSDKSIPLISPANFAALGVSRLEALGPDKAAMVTDEQKKDMTEEQLGALTRAIEGSRDQTNPEISTESRATEEMTASVKLLLVFLVGFVLL